MSCSEGQMFPGGHVKHDIMLLLHAIIHDTESPGTIISTQNKARGAV